MFSKFLLIFIVFLFITCSLLTVYGSFKKSEYEESRLGNNDYFSNTDDKRIIVKKSDGRNFLDEDIEEIKKEQNQMEEEKQEYLDSILQSYEAGINQRLSAALYG